MKNVLMVAEKPSLAASLAGILSSGRCTTRRGETTADEREREREEALNENEF